ncbi:MAG: glycogen phosphorylase, partial [Rubrivivax sp.]
KRRLAERIAAETGVIVNPNSLFDVQIKRMHEYKRQLLNVLHVVTRYQQILAHPHADWVPRTVVFAGKAASAYFMAKLVIKLINDVARVVNHDKRIGDKLKVVFIPNYRVSLAEVIIPAADLSEQISTAGTEASGTGNMKFSLNGALTIGTWDGANIEIAEHVGLEHIFIFGHRTEQVAALRASGYNPRRYYDHNYDLKTAIDRIAEGAFSPEEPGRFHDITRTLLESDYYLLLADYTDYLATQHKVDELYRKPAEWTRHAVLNVAGMGAFSSDRTIREYASEIWNVKPLFD